MQLRGRVTIVVACVLGVMVMGCATTPKGQPTSIKNAKTPAWSLKANQDEMIVAVSPARQSMQIAGTSAALLGAGIDAMVNDKYRNAIREVLVGYDAGKVFENRIEERLKAVLPGVKRVAGLGSTAGLDSRREAQDLRFAAVAEKGADVLLDLNMTYGIFGYEGILVAKLEGSLYTVPGGHKLWKDTVVVSAEPILANEKLADPTKQLGPNLSSPRLRAEDDAIAQWTGDGGKTVRTRFEAAVDGAVSAILCDLGLAEEASGEYYLGKLAMNRKQFPEANTHFEKSLSLDPGSLEAQNGRAVNLAHSGQVDKAIELAKAMTETNPDFGPAWFNLAWWYATAKKDPVLAKPCYERAKTLGMPEESKIEKLLAG